MENYGILLVDDEPAYHMIVTALLASFDEPVICVADAAAAFESIRTRRYDLILMDIHLGAVDGRLVTAELRTATDWSATCPIIAFTTLRPESGQRYFLEEGFDGWLPKPLSGPALIGLVRNWLGDHRLNVVADSAAKRLSVLLGERPAAMVIDRFHESMAAAVAAIDSGSDSRALGHSIGGLSGTLGFSVLSAAWLSLQDDAGVWPTVRSLTMEAIAQHQGGQKTA